MGQQSAGITVRNAIRMVGEFRDMLSDLEVNLPQECPAAKELAAVETVMGWMTGKDEPPISGAYRDALQNRVCALQIVELALRRRDAGTPLDPFVNHFRLLQSGSMRLAADSYAHEINHKLFELLVGLAVAAFASDVALDNPRHSGGDNPDVAATIDGRRWGFACKVPHSRSAQTIHDSIMKGYAQVERAEVDAGLVVLSSKNILRSSDLLPVGELNGRNGIRYWKPDRLTRMFGNTFDGLMNDVNRLIGAVERTSQATSRKSVPFVFWMGTTATLARVEGPTRPTLHTVAGGWRVALPDGPASDHETRQVLDRIHRALAR